MNFFKKNWALVLVLIIILIFTLQVLLYYATFKNLDFGWNWFSALADKEWFKDSEGNFIDDGLEGKWGAFGDFIGGILNPILGFITIVLLLIAHQKDNKRDESYIKQREIDLFLSRVQQLKQTHNDHINNLNLINIDKLNERNKLEFVQQGRFLFPTVLNSLAIVKSSFLQDGKFKGFTDQQLIELSIALLMNGDGQHFRQFFQKKYPIIDYAQVTLEIIKRADQRLKKLTNFEMLRGLRTQLSPYFRNLFHIVDTIDTNQIIDSQLKYELIKDIRVTMSSQEQVLLLLNACTDSGRKWNEKELIVKYKLCRNIGNHKVFSGIDLKEMVYNLIDSSPSISDKMKYKQDYFE